MKQDSKPRLIAVGGMSGSGKTSLASALLEFVPNAVHLDSDLTRKEIFGVSATTRLPTEAYSSEATQRVVDEMARRVKENIIAGKNVIVSATFLSPQSRAEEENLAAEAGAKFTGIWLQADLKVLFDRVAKRVDDASDAGVDIVKLQSSKDSGVIDWAIVNASQPRESVVSDALKIIRPAKGQPVPSAQPKRK